MIGRQDAYIDKTDVWAKLAAPVPRVRSAWRQDGKVTARDGKYFARFVCLHRSEHCARTARLGGAWRMGSHPRAAATRYAGWQMVEGVSAPSRRACKSSV
jgi:hypothetical protein